MEEGLDTRAKKAIVERITDVHKRETEQEITQMIEHVNRVKDTKKRIVETLERQSPEIHYVDIGITKNQLPDIIAWLCKLGFTFDVFESYAGTFLYYIRIKEVIRHSRMTSPKSLEQSILPRIGS
jgi:hypothetical protein